MHIHEKNAWFILGVMSTTLILYFGYVSLIRFDDAATSIFALSALSALPGFRRKPAGRVEYDERDRLIERKALLISLQVFYCGLIAGGLTAGFWRGWDSTATLWQMFSLLWAAMLFTWGVKSAATIVLYRRSVDA